jgi:hypothetical protein
MARNHRDLFEILGAGGGRRRGRHGRRHGWLARAWAVLTPASDRGERARARAPATRSLAFAVGVLAALGVGFALGRVTARGGGNGAELDSRRAGLEGTRSEGAGLDALGVRPGPLPAGPSTPPREKLEETLSNSFWILLAYDAPEFDLAGSLAAWFWEQGFPAVRVRQMSDRKTGGQRWAVVCYTDGSDHAALQRRLQAVQPPAFEPRLDLRNLPPAPHFPKPKS